MLLSECKYQKGINLDMESKIKRTVKSEEQILLEEIKKLSKEIKSIKRISKIKLKKANMWEYLIGFLGMAPTALVPAGLIASFIASPIINIFNESAATITAGAGLATSMFSPLLLMLSYCLEESSNVDSCIEDNKSRYKIAEQKTVILKEKEERLSEIKNQKTNTLEQSLCYENVKN